MDSKEVLKEKIANHLANWKASIDELKSKIEKAEVGAKAKLHDQMESLHDKRAKAEKILEDISATSQDAWEQVKSGVEQGWNELTRTAKNTMVRMRDAVAHPSRDEEIRQIAYHIWRDEGCPEGRHLDHWLKAESIWRARQQAANEPDKPARAKTKRPRKKAASAGQAKSRVRKTKAGSGKEPAGNGMKEP